MIDKNLILTTLKKNLKLDLEKLEAIAKAAHLNATHSELIAEDKHDTQAIEAQYLAGAQAKRASEIRSDLVKIESLTPHPLNRIGVGALVEVEAHGLYFISPSTGGSTIQINNIPIIVVSIASPIGKALLGLEVGDSTDITTPSGTHEYVIAAIE